MSDYEGIKNVPERIWLQVGDDDPESFLGDDFGDLADDGQVTWCADNQFEPDVPYVRVDKYKELEADIKAVELNYERILAERDRLREALQEIIQERAGYYMHIIAKKALEES